MLRNLVKSAVLAATLAVSVAPVAAGARDRADGYSRYDRGDRYQGRGYDQRRQYDRGDRYHRRGDDERRYYNRGRYTQHGYGGRRNCRSDGTTGAVIGAIAGGLLGNQVAGYGDKTLGTVLGGGAGLFAGRAIERGGNRC